MNRRDMLMGAATAGAAGVALLAAGTDVAHAQGTPAQTAGGVLDRIIKDKKIRVTAEVTSPPFGILDRNNQPTVYANVGASFPFAIYNRLESGFIGFDFHPDFARNKLVYVSYLKGDEKSQTLAISRGRLEGGSHGLVAFQRHRIGHVRLAGGARNQGLAAGGLALERQLQRRGGGQRAGQGEEGLRRA